MQAAESELRNGPSGNTTANTQTTGYVICSLTKDEARARRIAANIAKLPRKDWVACAFRFLRRPSRPNAPRPVANDRFVIRVVVHTFGYIIRHDALARSPSIVL